MSARQAKSAFALPALALAAQLLATSALAAPVGEPRLNGFWNIDDAARRQALAGVRAELTPAGQAIAKSNGELQAARIARGEVVGLGSFTCGLQGAPFFVGTSEPWLLVVTEEAAVQVNERRQISPRHFYLDGRSWPDISKMPPSSSGYSIAHWEGPVLVIETRGLPNGGTQGGGLKGPDSILTERVSLSPDGNRLTWAFSWANPVLLAKPYGYAIQYDRAPEHTYALTHECDPNENPGAVSSPPEQE
jgi:hypothetical protein